MFTKKFKKIIWPNIILLKELFSTKKIFCPPKNCFHQKTFFTRNFFFTQPLKINIMQPLHNKSTKPLHNKKNHATSQQKKLRNLHTKKITQTEWVRKITQPLHIINHATSPHKSHVTFFFTQKIMQALNKTSQELQNAALRTSHRLSNVSNCTFQKYWESKKKIFFFQ